LLNTGFFDIIFVFSLLIIGVDEISYPHFVDKLWTGYSLLCVEICPQQVDNVEKPLFFLIIYFSTLIDLYNYKSTIISPCIFYAFTKIPLKGGLPVGKHCGFME
jgi:hypothetical protein